MHRRLAWSDVPLDGGHGRLAARGRQCVGRAQRTISASRGGIPVTGDWNGDGTTKIGVFIDGRWFLDLNGNGVWDEGDLWAKLGTRGRSAGHRRLGRRRQDRHRHLRSGVDRRPVGDRGRAGPARRRQQSAACRTSTKNVPPDRGRRRRRRAHAEADGQAARCAPT